jgi:hypothetical protein
VTDECIVHMMCIKATRRMSTVNSNKKVKQRIRIKKKCSMLGLIMSTYLRYLFEHRFKYGVRSPNYLGSVCTSVLIGSSECSVHFFPANALVSKLKLHEDLFLQIELHLILHIPVHCFYLRNGLGYTRVLDGLPSVICAMIYG